MQGFIHTVVVLSYYFVALFVVFQSVFISYKCLHQYFAKRYFSVFNCMNTSI